MTEIIAATVFGLGYLAISLEHRLFLNKAAISLLLATLLWLLTTVTIPVDVIQHAISEAGADIFGIVIFLLSAMTLVEILVHYHLFDIIELKLRQRGWTYYQLGWAVAAMAFVFSGIIDNLTATIVAIQISRRLFLKENLIAIGSLIVIAANAGGAFSPIGDITTLMLWFAGKFTASEIITQGIIPSITLGLVASWLILRRIPKTVCLCPDEMQQFKASRSDKAIIAATLGSFILPLAAASLKLPPYMGLIAGLGMIWLLIDIAKKARPQETHLQADIRGFFQQTDIESIQFFVGILLSVAALHALGIIDVFTHALLGTDPSLARIVTAFTGLGVGSAIVDNVPLTAAVISSLEGISTQLWVLLSLTVGTGGSILVIGSAAGVVAMGMLPELTFGKFLKTGSFPAFAAFIAAIIIWGIQTAIFF